LDQAEQSGIQPKISWDFDNLFSLQEILPKHAPDIITRIQARVKKGSDKILVMSYNNGLSAAMTEAEFNRHIDWAISNPDGSGIKDIFKTYSPIYRPQEMMFTPGTARLLQNRGIDSVILFYSDTPFSTFSLFTDKLSVSQKHNPIRLIDNESSIKIIPSYHIGDIVSHISIGRWIDQLKQHQSENNGDLLLNINFDADVDFWTDEMLPWIFRFLPSTGGLMEILLDIHKRPGVEFVHLEEYLKTHPVQKEITIGQDLADGSYDGFSSWSDKLSSQYLWTCVQRSRFIEKYLDPKSESGKKLFDQNFNLRMRLLSTTHFGMATPELNPERLKAALQICDQLQTLQKTISVKALAPTKTSAMHPSIQPLELSNNQLIGIEGSGIGFPQGLLPSVSEHDALGKIYFFESDKTFAQTLPTEITEMEFKLLKGLGSDQSFKIIKNNFLNQVSEYFLNYQKISPANLEISASNNAITNKWIGFSDSVSTYVLIFDPRFATSFAAVPVKTVSANQLSYLQLNPLGVYHGHQPYKLGYWQSLFDIGRQLTLWTGAQFKSGAQSFAGGRQHFRVGIFAVKGSSLHPAVIAAIGDLHNQLEQTVDFTNFPIELKPVR
jgi:hypothetical protein